TRQEPSGPCGGDLIGGQQGSDPLGRLPCQRSRGQKHRLAGRLEQRATNFETAQGELMHVHPPSEQERPASDVIDRTVIRVSLCSSVQHTAVEQTGARNACVRRKSTATQGFRSFGSTPSPNPLWRASRSFRGRSFWGTSVFVMD